MSNYENRSEEVTSTEALIWSEDFSAGKLEAGTYHNAGIVQQETGNHIARVGRVHTEGSDTPMKNTSIDRGSITFTVKNLEPSTSYKFTAKACVDGEKGKMWVGVVDFENELYHIPKDVHEEVTSTSWTDVTVELTTGPRTSEVAFYCLLVGLPSLGYLKDLSVYKINRQSENLTNESTTSFEHAEDEFPVTIPAVQKFTFDGRSGNWYLPKEGRIIITENDKKLLYDDAKLFQSELINATAEKADYTVTVGKQTDAKPGDIVFTLKQGIDKTNGYTGEEAYQIDINQKVITITSSSSTGIFYGTRTILQALKTQNWLPSGTVIDWPKDKFRGLQVDTGRRYFSIDWLKQQIRDLAWTKMNLLHIRLKDGEGLRVESDVAPELVSPEHYSKQEIRDLIAYAKRYHVTIVPEIDTPGHSNMDVKVYPHYGLKLNDGSLQGVLDYTKPEVREYVKRLVEEFADLFQSPYFHLGGDEYEQKPEDAPHLLDWAKEQLGPGATWYDGYELYLNELGELLLDKGIRPWVWNDMVDPGEGVFDLNKQFIIDYWAKWDRSPLIEEFHKAGYETVNKNADWLYYDLWPNKIGGDDPRRFPQNLYEVWQTDAYMKKAAWGKPVTRPQDDHTVYLENQGAGHLGAMFAIWDDPHTWPAESWVSKGMLPRFRAYAQKAWGLTNQIETYAEFESYIYRIGYAL
ncbi:family 20 glycosylhydrolase [Bacillus niameyensis]|uniref:family 20 glycosylhydrolase n=1 Tax=Bacillus niameyensis TaxID=1522308 RepID=UPI000783B088|nr:family 20 glycosylhydrolase [Bacillus niameyensis]